MGSVRDPTNQGCNDQQCRDNQGFLSGSRSGPWGEIRVDTRASIVGGAVAGNPRQGVLLSFFHPSSSLNVRKSCTCSTPLPLPPALSLRERETGPRVRYEPQRDIGRRRSA